MTREIVWKEVRDQGTVLAALLVMGCGVLAAAAILTETTDTGRANELRSLVVASRLALVMLAMTAGVVVGGTLFAGEREAGTFAFLDRLPGSRWAVWWRKVLTGWVMVVLAAGVFLAAGISLGALGSGSALPGWVAMVLVVTLIGYGWGVFGSVFARTSLSACATGLVACACAGVLVYFGSALVITLARALFRVRLNFAGSMWETMSVVTVYSLLAIPIPLAGWFFTTADRQRFQPDGSAPVRDLKGAVRAGMRALDPVRCALGSGRLLWLVRRQAATPAAVLVGGFLAAGAVLLPEFWPAMFVWPFVSLVAGVLAAVAVMADEQGSDAARFWGERRIPLWRFWGAKIVASTALTLATLVALLVLPAAALSFGKGAQGPLVPSLFRSALPMDMGPRTLVLYLMTWPAYGVVFGHLSALLFRKAIVAVAVGVMAAGIFASLWLPSLLAGGVHTWQVMGPAVVALVTARAVLWAWSTDRLGTRPALTRLGTGLAACVAVAGAGIGYRVVEIPVIAQAEDDLRFAATLPTYDDTQSGRDIRRAVSLFNEIALSYREQVPERPLPSPEQDVPAGFNPRAQAYIFRLSAVFNREWPADRPDLDAWLEGMTTTTDWPATLTEAAKKPVGVYVDPNELHVRSLLPAVQDLRPIPAVHLADGLRRQAHGDPAAFLTILDTELFVARSTRTNTIAMSVFVSWAIEEDALNALDRWLERLDGRPELLRRALAIVHDHDRTDPFDAHAVRLAGQTIARNGVIAPGQWLPRHLQEEKPGGLRPDTLGQVDDASQTEATVVGVSWAFPWEQERLRRVNGLGNVPGTLRERAEYLRGAPGADLILFTTHDRVLDSLGPEHSNVLARRRAATLKLALRLYQHDTGALPDRLDRLVPRYLPELPADPFDKSPFRYRVSRGEQLEMGTRAPDPFGGQPPGLAPRPLSADEFHAVAGLAGGGACWPLAPEWLDSPIDLIPAMPSSGVPATPVGSDRQVVTVPRGRGILWSVGPDRRDGGGVRLSLSGTSHTLQRPTEDLIFVVPTTLPKTR